jgi:diguanylate cyclase (GGDEF)-like protein
VNNVVVAAVDEPRRAAPPSGTEADVVVQALRALLRAETPGDVQAALTAAVHGLGGAVASPRSSGHGQLPLDVAYGSVEPLVPTADPATLARLAEVLPALAADAAVAMDRVIRGEFLVESATVDPLTRMNNRRVAMAVLGGLRPGDAVVLLDLDHFKALNDTCGHEAGDDVLRAFGETLTAVVRSTDTAVRYGGEEFVLLLPRTTVDAAVDVVRRIRSRWEQVRPYPTTFSAGVAVVTVEGGRAALKLADGAMYVAKAHGRDRVEVAGQA